VKVASFEKKNCGADEGKYLFVGSYKIKEDKSQTRSNILRKPQFFQRRSNAYFLEQSKY
jgi:hypothetical protein